VIVASGARDDGFTLYVKGERLIYEKKSLLSASPDVITSSDRLPTGSVEVAYEFTREVQGGDRGRLYIDGRLVGERKLAASSLWGSAGIDIGQNFPSPVSQAYQAPFKFTGVIEKVQIELQ